jgi:acyl-CoA thioester hydrolase
MDVRIYYEDTDCGGIVYYANYFKYFERARTHYLEERGLSVGSLLKDGTQFVVAHAHADYRSPARYGDTLAIETTLRDSGRASLTFAHVIRERSSGRLLVEGTATLVSVDLDGKVKRLASAVLQTLRTSDTMDGKRKTPVRRSASRKKKRNAS